MPGIFPSSLVDDCPRQGAEVPEVSSFPQVGGDEFDLKTYLIRVSKKHVESLNQPGGKRKLYWQPSLIGTLRQVHTIQCTDDRIWNWRVSSSKQYNLRLYGLHERKHWRRDAVSGYGQRIVYKP